MDGIYAAISVYAMFPLLHRLALDGAGIYQSAGLAAFLPLYLHIIQKCLAGGKLQCCLLGCRPIEIELSR